MEYLSSEIHLKIWYDPRVNCVWAEWNGYVGDLLLRDGMNKLLGLLYVQQPANILLDWSDFHTMTLNDQRWVNEEWFPRLLRIGVQKIAVILSSHILAQRPNLMPSQYESSEVAYFSVVQEAVWWFEGIDIGF